MQVLSRLPGAETFEGKEIEELLRENKIRRRAFLAAFLPSLNTGNALVLFYPLSVLTSADLGCRKSNHRPASSVQSSGLTLSILSLEAVSLTDPQLWSLAFREWERQC
jgi:hypothetical protein